MAAKSATANEAAQQDAFELNITRIFDAPRNLVYQAWTQPAHLERWQGAPEGMTVTSIQKDLRPGGMMKLCMRSADGQDHWLQAVYREVVENERLVFTHTRLDAQGNPGKETLVTITFADRAGKTELKLRQTGFKSVQSRDGHMGGWNSMLDRFGGYLLKMPAETKAEPKEFVITRVFDAPRQLVWKAWTERDRLMQWFGPKGWTMAVGTLDFRPDGMFHYCMRTPDGKEMWGKFVYREIVPPERIVLVSSFSDENGGIARHPFSSTWPLETLSTTTFTEHEGKTTITLRWAPLNATETEQKTFDTAHEGMNMGWTGTFDQLADYLAKAQAGDKP